MKQLAGHALSAAQPCACHRFVPIPMVLRSREMILVVEDNPDVKTVATTLLEQLNYRTIAVESAKAALDFLAAGKPVDLVFSDVMLPGASMAWDWRALSASNIHTFRYCYERRRKHSAASTGCRSDESPIRFPPAPKQCVQCSASDRRDSREAYRGLPPMAGGVVALASPGYVLQPRSARPRQEWTADPLTGGQT